MKGERRESLCKGSAESVVFREEERQGGIEAWGLLRGTLFTQELCSFMRLLGPLEAQSSVDRGFEQGTRGQEICLLNSQDTDPR